MKYLIYNNDTDLNIRNNEIALLKGCDRKPEDQTEYWFSLIKHPTQDLWALCVDNESLLTYQEQLKLKTYDDLLADEWFENVV